MFFWRSKAARCTRTLWRARRWPALLLLAAWCWRALAAEAPPEPRPIFAFDIPAQPLQAALEQYSNVTGGSVVYRAALTVGRRSAAVKGIHTPEAALRMLIEGSGLVAEYTATNAVVLQPEPAAPAVARRPANPTGSFYRSYYGLIQAGVRDALCGLPALAVGSFRAAVSFGVSEQGRVQDAHLLDSSGDAGRDEAITQALNGIALGKAPPEGLAQPFVMLIVPQSADHDRACAIR
ncbi:TonB C-terminal domain-containing protein [Achromobacter sp. Marseille-Q0513]|uniref:TonB C-terminal domain-containing protein n=1 Tax=Achromobacter sp. Marseille-Q0513 TaxID=2829161 RepID=UPI001B9100AB|nr:TonB C-terminal domain-containing protein [Achromobacter sp. Marseille-Q0513]MBR8654489.1 TonB C-terminal domain-containing protein [Achromobacter sp. Marseille-Q0513]